MLGGAPSAHAHAPARHRQPTAPSTARAARPLRLLLGVLALAGACCGLLTIPRAWGARPAPPARGAKPRRGIHKLQGKLGSLAKEHWAPFTSAAAFSAYAAANKATANLVLALFPSPPAGVGGVDPDARALKTLTREFPLLDFAVVADDALYLEFATSEALFRDDLYHLVADVGGLEAGPGGGAGCAQGGGPEGGPTCPPQLLYVGEDSTVPFDSSWEEDELRQFLSSWTFSRVGRATRESVKRYYRVGLPVVWHFVDEASALHQQYLESLREMSASYFEQVFSFVYAGPEELRELAGTLGLDDHDLPQVVVDYTGVGAGEGRPLDAPRFVPFPNRTSVRISEELKWLNQLEEEALAAQVGAARAGAGGADANPPAPEPTEGGGDTMAAAAAAAAVLEGGLNPQEADEYEAYLREQMDEHAEGGYEYEEDLEFPDVAIGPLHEELRRR